MFPFFFCFFKLDLLKYFMYIALLEYIRILNRMLLFFFFAKLMELIFFTHDIQVSS